MSGTNATYNRLLTPVESLGQAAQTVNAINQVRNYNANRLVGQAYQQSIDPSTGLPSQAVLGSNLSQLSPDAAVAIPAALTRSQELQTAQQGAAMQRFGWMANAMGSLISDGEGQGPTFDRVQQTLAAGMKAGYLNQQDVGSALIGMPTGDDPKSMATRLHMLQTVNEQIQTAQQRLLNVNGTPGSVQNGQTIQPVMVGGQLSRTPGAFTPAGAATQLQTGPETNAGLIETYQPDPSNPGQYIKVMQPRSALPGASGVTGRGAPIGGAGSTGRYPARPGSAPVQGGVQPPPPSNAAPAQTSQAGPILAAPPGNVQANNDADVAAFKKDQLAAPAVNNTIQNLQHAYDALQTVGTGPSTEAMQRMKSFLLARGVLPQGLSEDVKNYDLFRKYTEKYALDQAGNTDAGRAMSAASNAGTAISTPANFDVLRNEIGKQRQIAAQVMDAPDQTGLGYGAHAQKFTSSLDPRGFAVDLYKPAELQNLLKSMPNDAARNRFQKTVGTALRLGIVGGRSTAAPAPAPTAAAPQPSPVSAPSAPPPSVPTEY